MLCNLHCLKARLRLLGNKYQRHSSPNLVSQQLKSCDIFIFGMAYFQFLISDTLRWRIINWKAFSYLWLKYQTVSRCTNVGGSMLPWSTLKIRSLRLIKNVCPGICNEIRAALVFKVHVSFFSFQKNRYFESYCSDYAPPPPPPTSVKCALYMDMKSHLCAKLSLAKNMWNNFFQIKVYFYMLIQLPLLL